MELLEARAKYDEAKATYKAALLAELDSIEVAGERPIKNGAAEPIKSNGTVTISNDILLKHVPIGFTKAVSYRQIAKNASMVPSQVFIELRNLSSDGKVKSLANGAQTKFYIDEEPKSEVSQETLV